MDKNSFVQDLENINRVDALNISQNNAETALEQLLIVISSLIDKHAPLRQIIDWEVKTKSKPWLTTVILTSIKNKNKTIWRAKDQTRKDQFFHQFKKYRNLLSNLTKQSKNDYKHTLKKIKRKYGTE